MLRLPRSLAAWPAATFPQVLKQELEALGGGQLPLQQCLTTTAYALDDKIEVMVISAAETPDGIRARIGVFFAGLVIGCNCADDPTPVEPQSEYGELEVTIERSGGAASFAVATTVDAS